MIKKHSLTEVIIYVCLIMLFLSSSILMTDEFSYLQNLLVPIALAVILFMGFIHRVKINVYGRSMVLFFLFLISSTISALVNMELNLIFRSGQLFMSFVALSIILPQLIPIDYTKTIIKMILISHTPLIVVPLLSNGIDRVPYSGFFYNPNSLGTVVVTLIPIILILLYEQVELNKAKSKNKVRIKSKISFFTWSVTTIFCIFLVLISQSRTSFAAMLVLIFTFLMMVLIKLGLIKSLKVTIPLATVFALITFMTPAISEAFEGLLNKHTRRAAASSGITANRADYWIETLNNSSLFGGGSIFFRSVVERSAHNTFFSILGIFGWIPLLFFLTWLFELTIKSFKLVIRHKSAYDLFPFFMIMSFITLSMGEGMLMKLSMIAMFASIGVFTNKCK